jgi:hypothetical protein
LSHFVSVDSQPLALWSVDSSDSLLHSSLINSWQFYFSLCTLLPPSGVVHIQDVFLVSRIANMRIIYGNLRRMVNG